MPCVAISLADDAVEVATRQRFQHFDICIVQILSQCKLVSGLFSHHDMHIDMSTQQQ